MFSEILTTLNGEGDGSQHSQSGGSVDSGPSQPRREEARTLDIDLGPIHARRRADAQTPSYTPSQSPSRADEPLPASGLRTPPPSLIRESFTRTPLPTGGQVPAASILSRWSEEDDPAALPGYLMGVEQPSDRRRPELITYRPDPGDPGPAVSPLVIWGRRLLIATVVVPMGSMLALLAAITLVASIGTWRVRSATSEVTAAQVALSERVLKEEALPRELELLGADGAALREAYRRWDRTPAEPERSWAALAYIQRAEVEAHGRIPLTGRSHTEELVRQRLDRLGGSRDAVTAAERALDQAAGTAPGRLSILLGLAPTPVLGSVGAAAAP